MNDTMLDTVTRHAAGMASRRGSLRLLGRAALTGALAAPMTGSASKAGKKARERCQEQRGACIAAIEDRCASNIDPAVCEAMLNPCCAHFARCNTGTGILCLFNIE
jgi:hypothetical protein